MKRHFVTYLLLLRKHKWITIDPRPEFRPTTKAHTNTPLQRTITYSIGRGDRYDYPKTKVLPDLDARSCGASTICSGNSEHAS